MKLVLALSLAAFTFGLSSCACCTSAKKKTADCSECSSCCDAKVTPKKK